MFGSYNEATVIGNLGRDPEVRTSQNGGSRIASFSVATSETWNDKATGERKDKTQWHRISVFNERLVDLVEKHLKKGSKVMIKGQIESTGSSDGESRPSSSGKTSAKPELKAKPTTDDDDIPF